jgi:hypothetical protein
VAEDAIALRALHAEELEREGEQAGLSPREREHIPASDEYVGSTVVMFGD